MKKYTKIMIVFLIIYVCLLVFLKRQTNDTYASQLPKVDAYNVVLFYAGTVGVIMGAFSSWMFYLKPENNKLSNK